MVSKLGILAPEDGDPYIEKPVDDRDLAEMLIQSGENNIIGRVFERYPINCIGICNFDAKKLDTLINRFKESENKDIDLLVEIISFIRNTPQREVEPYPIIDNVKKYIEKHLSEEFSVSALAEHMNISLYYLSHLFKSVTGTTIIEYRNELRLTTAKIMLIDSDDSISSIAESTGFCSPAYFTEIFTKSEKIPPSEYRKYHKK